MDAEFDQLCKVLLLHPKVLKQLSKEGITSISSLLQAKHRIDADEIKVHSTFKEELCRVICFVQSFQTNRGRAMKVTTKFHDESFGEFKRSLPRKIQVFEQRLINLVLFGGHIPGSGGMELMEVLKESGAMPVLISFV